MNRFIRLFLSLTLILNGHAAHAIQVIWFQGDNQSLQEGAVKLNTGGYHNEYGNQISNYPFEAIVILENGSAYYAQHGVTPNGVNYYTNEEEVSLSNDGKTVSGKYIVSRGTSIDNASEKTIPTYADGKGHGNSPGKGPAQADNLGSALSSGLAFAGTALMNGLYTTGEQILMGLVLSGESAKHSAQLTYEITEISKYNAQISHLNLQMQNQALVESYRNYKALSEQNINLFEDNYEFKVKDPQAANSLKLNRTVLNSAYSFDPKRRYAKQKGLEFNQEADQAYSQGNTEDGDGYLKYARAFADIAIGLDPVTGPIRSTYEAITGRNLITGEELSDVERAFAVVGAVSFGFGSQIGRGFKVLQKTKILQTFSKNFDKAIELGSKIAAHGKVLTQADYRAAKKAAPELIQQIIKENPAELSKYVSLINETKAIEFVADGSVAKQALTKEGLDLYSKVQSGENKVYRLGKRKFNKELTDNFTPQYWSAKTENLNLSFDQYADEMGSYSKDFDFIQVAEYTGEGRFIVRQAPPGKIKVGPGQIITTKGGGYEVVVRVEAGSPRTLKPLANESFDAAQISGNQEKFFGDIFDSFK